MELSHVVILALIQALTEFLPVSSSGHLALAGFFFGWPYQGLTFDLALHLGTLAAVLAYFRRDFAHLTRATLAIRPGRPLDVMQRLAVGLALSTIPAAIAGLAMGERLAEALRDPRLIAVNLIVFGVVLYLAERLGHGTRREADVGPARALAIGAAQILALVPGTSRSGITMSAALALGLTREAAARYSFLMSVPITALAIAHAVMTMVRANEAVAWREMIVGIVISGVAGIAVIHLLLGVVRRVGTWPFVVYRIALGVVILAWFYTRASPTA